ncbi:MAG: M20 peptidase family dipeptidase, partial [Pseudonocardia sp.]
MTRSEALRQAATYVDSGAFHTELSRRVAMRTESQDPAALPQLHRYLTDEIGPALDRLGARWHVVENPLPGGGPFLVG